MATHIAAKQVAEKFVGEAQETKYNHYTRFVEPITQDPVYYARGDYEYDLVIPLGVLSNILQRRPWLWGRLIFVGTNENGAVFSAFNVKGPWNPDCDKFFGNSVIFQDVWPIEVKNLDACERIDLYRPIFEQVIKDILDEQEKANQTKTTEETKDF